MNILPSVRLLAVLGILLTAISGVRAEPKEPEPVPVPVPKGQPTTAQNVHLPSEGEIRLGRETAVEIEKHFKVIPDGPLAERLKRVSDQVVAAIRRPEIAQEYVKVYELPRKGDKARRLPFEYSFKVIDAGKMVNAFSLAGGPIYVTKALLEFTPSDDELAGVLAHECAHVAFHHVEQMARLQKKQAKNQIWALLATIIAGVAGGGGALQGAFPALAGAQLITTAMMTGYSRELEHEADRVGVMALTNTRFQPTGMLTFMQKLAREDKLRGNPDFGIYQSHPYPNQRVDALTEQIASLGYPVDRGALRRVNGSFVVEAVPVTKGGRELAEVRLNRERLFLVVNPDDHATPLARAQRIARDLEDLFADNLSDNQVRLNPERGLLLLKGIPVIRVFPEDGAEVGGQEEALDAAYKGVMRALLKERLDAPAAL
ncbi:MAG: M48 family metalloprotease [Armatimonadota bacterium]